MLLEGLTAAGWLDRERELHQLAERSSTEFVRVWETEPHAVVLGRSCRIESEVNMASCEADRVPVLRRETGGGAVLLGRGCLNYTLILSLERRPELRDVEESFWLILNSVIQSLGIVEARREGTDLVLCGRKFGGCSQRRLKRTVLHHGTILYDFELAAVNRYLREPSRQPAHRQRRTHSEFLTNVALDPGFAARLAQRFPEAEVAG